MAGGDVSGLYKDPDHGPQSASKVIAVLHQIFPHHAAHQTADHRWRAWRRRRALGSA